MKHYKVTLHLVDIFPACDKDHATRIFWESVRDAQEAEEQAVVEEISVEDYNEMLENWGKDDNHPPRRT